MSAGVVFPAYRQLLVRNSGSTASTNHDFLINPRIKHGPDTSLFRFDTGTVQ